MSYEASNWANGMKGRGLSPFQKVVLYKLADCHNPIYGCFPRQEWLAEECEISPRALRDALSALEEKGLIRRERINGKFGQREGTRYHLEFEFSLPVNDAARIPTGKSRESLPAANGHPYRQMLPVYNKEESCNRTSNTTQNARERDFVDLVRLEAQIRDAAGEALADVAEHPQLAIISPLATLLRIDPPVLPEEIVEGVRYAAAYYLKRRGPRSMHSWRTAANKAQELRDDRLSPRPVVSTSKPNVKTKPGKSEIGPFDGWDYRTWKLMVKMAAYRGFKWRESMGPPPDEEGCLCPESLQRLWKLGPNDNPLCYAHCDWERTFLILKRDGLDWSDRLGPSPGLKHSIVPEELVPKWRKSLKREGVG